MKTELQAIKEELLSLARRVDDLMKGQEDEPKPVDGQIMSYHGAKYRFVADDGVLCGECAFLHSPCGDDDVIDCRGGYWEEAW